MWLCLSLCRIGDAYVCVSGLAFTQPDQAGECVASMCRCHLGAWSLAAPAKSEEGKAEDAAHRLVQMAFSMHEAVCSLPYGLCCP